MRYTFSSPKKRKIIVIALGGSIVYPGTEPDGIDTEFLKKFKRFITQFLRRRGAKGRDSVRFVFVVGGGKLARRFQDAAHRVSKLTDEDKDWIGIHATRLNGHLLRTIFRDVADPVMIDKRGRIKRLTHPVTIAAGWRPGWSTDYVAMQIAADFGASEAIIAGKPSHVFDRDPAKATTGGRSKHGSINSANPPPKSFDALTWREYRKLIPSKWSPGMGAPVDPVAAALGVRASIRAIVIDGRNLTNFAALLNGKEFRGTIVG
jgi:uridylate kinase